ncbi:MAG: ParA family protein [Pseudomonadota bacterium]
MRQGRPNWKSTVATSLASFYASEGFSVSLADYDPQGSSLDWLEERSDELPKIDGLEAYTDGLRHINRNADYLVVDAPARSHGTELTNLVRHAETIIVPVMPSAIDMKATKRFIEELRNVGKVDRREAKIGLIANRVKENTLIFEELDEFLEKQRIPYLTALREAQNYVRAYSRGLGIFDLPEYLAWPDWEQWDPILEWLDSRRSRP